MVIGRRSNGTPSKEDPHRPALSSPDSHPACSIAVLPFCFEFLNNRYVRGSLGWLGEEAVFHKFSLCLWKKKADKIPVFYFLHE